MNEFERQYAELRVFLDFDDYNILTKRVIDLALDTESIDFYRKANKFLDQLDVNSERDKKQLFSDFLNALYSELSLKPQTPREIIVSTKNLQKSYGNAAFSLGPIDLEVRQGEILGLVGENGNGKTTLLRLLCGELYATGGELKYNFEYTDNYDLRSQLVYIPQRTESWYGPMRENLQFTAASYGYSPEENALVVELIIARFGLRKFRDHSWKSLSSGYKMRFELARMLLRKPKILLIDEPLANLDILAQQTVLDDFRAIAKSPFRPLGIVMSSQQLYEVEKTSDQVIFLKNGSQKNLHATQKSGETTAGPTVIEFESPLPQPVLGEIFSQHQMLSLQFNGGTYIVTFPESFSSNDFLLLIANHNIPLMYFRDISNSTRRFFT